MLLILSVINRHYCKVSLWLNERDVFEGKAIFFENQFPIQYNEMVFLQADEEVLNLRIWTISVFEARKSLILNNYRFSPLFLSFL